jgi:hypothetical protein
MLKKELAPGIVVYRPAFNRIDELLSNIKDAELLLPDFYNVDWHHWGELEGFKKAEINLEKIQNNLSEYSNLKNIDLYMDFYSLYKSITFQYLNDVKPLNILKPYIDYNTDCDSWLFGECMVQVHSDHGIDTHSGMALGFHLDIADSNLGEGTKHIFTGNLYLNDDYDSGEIIFLFPSDLNSPNDFENFKSITYKPKQGDFVFYPADWPVIHGVNFAFGADRYIMVSTTKWQYDGSMGKSLKDYMFEDLSVLNDIERNIKEQNKEYIDGRLI